MELSRREFLKKGIGGLLGAVIAYGGMSTIFKGLAVANTPPGPVGIESGSTPSWRFIVDIGKCIGCGKCAVACKTENDVPMDSEYNRTWVERYVYTRTEDVLVDSPQAGINGFGGEDNNAKFQGMDIVKSFFVPKLCNHCQSAPCIQVCPVAATYATDEGIVLVDRKACIGCRYCVQACPYGARFLDPRLKVVDKCTWCYHRITKGLHPACVEVCPTGARVFGDIREEESPISRIINEETLGVLKSDLGTKPLVYYIGLEKGVH